MFPIFPPLGTAVLFRHERRTSRPNPYSGCGRGALLAASTLASRVSLVPASLSYRLLSLPPSPPAAIGRVVKARHRSEVSSSSVRKWGGLIRLFPGYWLPVLI